MFDILYTWLQFQSRAQCDFLQMCFFCVCARARPIAVCIYFVPSVAFSAAHYTMRRAVVCRILFQNTHTHSLCECCSLHWIKHNWMTHSRIAHTSLWRGGGDILYDTQRAIRNNTPHSTHICYIICNINCYYTSVLMHLWARGCLKCARLWLSSFLFIYSLRDL